MSFQIGDRVQVGSRFGANLEWATVINIIPGFADRVPMFRVRFDKPVNRDGRRTENMEASIVLAVEQQQDSYFPTTNDCWVDESLLYGPFLDQNSPHYH